VSQRPRYAPSPRRIDAHVAYYWRRRCVRARRPPTPTSTRALGGNASNRFSTYHTHDHTHTHTRTRTRTRTRAQTHSCVGLGHGLGKAASPCRLMWVEGVVVRTVHGSGCAWPFARLQQRLERMCAEHPLPMVVRRWRNHDSTMLRGGDHGGGVFARAATRRCKLSTPSVCVSAPWASWVER